MPPPLLRMAPPPELKPLELLLGAVERIAGAVLLLGWLKLLLLG